MPDVGAGAAAGWCRAYRRACVPARASGMVERDYMSVARAARLSPGESKWPKRFPPLTAEQEAIRDDFMKRWLETLPRKYGAIERFNHLYAVRQWHAARPGTGTVRTLEVGAGIGAHIGYEDLRGQDYYALEMRENVIAVLKERHPEVTAVQGNIETGTTFADAFFERVVNVHVLEHLRNLPQAVNEIRRVMTPRGICSVVAPCEGGLAYGLARRISAQRLFEKTYRTPYRWFIEREHVSTYEEIREELERHFRIIHTRRWPLPFAPVTANLVIGMTMTPR